MVLPNSPEVQASREPDHGNGPGMAVSYVLLPLLSPLCFYLIFFVSLSFSITVDFLLIRLISQDEQICLSSF